MKVREIGKSRKLKGYTREIRQIPKDNASVNTSTIWTADKHWQDSRLPILLCSQPCVTSPDSI